MPGIAQPAKDQGEGRQAEVGFGLAAAGREEEQVHDLAVVRASGRRSRAGSSGGRRAGTAATPARRLDLLLHDEPTSGAFATVSVGQLE